MHCNGNFLRFFFNLGVEVTGRPSKATVATAKLVVLAEIDGISDEESYTYLIFRLLLGGLFILLTAIGNGETY